MPHTPGPWGWISDHTHKQFDVYELAERIDAELDSKHICTINNLPRHKLENRNAETALANTKLIAASPDLLRAVELWEQFLDAMPKGQLGKIVCDIGLLNEAFVATRQALAKAKGA